jgi:hypothetical protein
LLYFETPRNVALKFRYVNCSAFAKSKGRKRYIIAGMEE